MIRLKILSFFLILLLPQTCESRSVTDERRREFFNEKIPQEKKPSKPVFEILSMNKGTIQGWIYDAGPGTRLLRCIEVKFKIHREEETRLPYFYVYLYDSRKAFIQRLEEMFIKEITESKEIDPAIFSFKGKKTYTVQFDYPNEVLFKYYLVVLGKPGNVSVRAEPGNVSWKEFDFPEKNNFFSVPLQNNDLPAV